MKIRIASFIALLFILGFLFISILPQVLPPSVELPSQEEIDAWVNKFENDIQTLNNEISGLKDKELIAEYKNKITLLEKAKTRIPEWHSENQGNPVGFYRYVVGLIRPEFLEPEPQINEEVVLVKNIEAYRKSGVTLHPAGYPLGNEDIFKTATADKTSTSENKIYQPYKGNVYTMDDYFLRNGQVETGSNNIVTSVVFDYRGFDTLGEGTVLFIAVSSISMLLFHILKRKKKGVIEKKSFKEDVSRIIAYSALFLFPLIIIFGAYLVIHGHLTPGGGFQGGAVMASGTALILVTGFIARNSKMTRKILSVFESLALTIFICMGFAGITTAFLYNFMATPDSLFNTVAFGPNLGDLTSAGILPIISLAVGIEVFCGISIILVSLFHASKEDKEETEGAS